jgi:hypothetical protein
MFNERERFRHRYVRLIETFKPEQLPIGTGENHHDIPTSELSSEFLEIRKSVSEVLTGRVILVLKVKFKHYRKIHKAGLILPVCLKVDMVVQI